MPLSIQGRPDETVGVRVLHSSLDAGVTFIDTANVYCLDNGDIGHNERLIARALETWPCADKSVLVGTKGGLTRPRGRWESDARPDRLRRACEQSLKALGVDCIDLYQLHAPDPRVPLTDSVGVIAELQHEGKIRWVGLSNVSVDEIKIAESMVPIITVQNRLNPFFRQAIDDGVVDYCTRRGIGFLAYSPLGGRQLNKTLLDHPTLKPIAGRHGVSPHAVVLAWILAQGPNVVPIPGARRPEHVVDSANAVKVVLDEQELAAIDQAKFARA